MLRPVGLQRVSRIGWASMRRSCVGVGCCRSPGTGHHNLACVGFRGEVVPGQDLVFEGQLSRATRKGELVAVSRAIVRGWCAVLQQRGVRR